VRLLILVPAPPPAPARAAARPRARRFFGEKGIMRTLVELFRERSSFVRVQIIQTVSIILMNINNQRSLCECAAAA
jgi:hypothetical protein